jgi:hypothetical protein
MAKNKKNGSVCAVVEKALSETALNVATAMQMDRDYTVVELLDLSTDDTYNRKTNASLRLFGDTVVGPLKAKGYIEQVAKKPSRYGLKETRTKV